MIWKAKKSNEGDSNTRGTEEASKSPTKITEIAQKLEVTSPSKIENKN